MRYTDHHTTCFDPSYGTSCPCCCLSARAAAYPPTAQAAPPPLEVPAAPALTVTRGTAYYLHQGRQVVYAGAGLLDDAWSCPSFAYDAAAEGTGAFSTLPTELAALAMPVPAMTGSYALYLTLAPDTAPLARAQHGATAVRDYAQVARWGLAAAGMAEPAAGIAAGAAALTMPLQAANFAINAHRFWGAAREIGALREMRDAVMQGSQQAMNTMLIAADNTPDVALQGRTIWESNLLSERFSRVKFIINQLKRERKWELASASGHMTNAALGFCLAGASCGLAIAALAGVGCPPASLAILAVGAGVGLVGAGVHYGKKLAKQTHYHREYEHWLDRTVSDIDFLVRSGAPPRIALHVSNSLSRIERLMKAVAKKRSFGCIRSRVSFLRDGSDVLARIMYAELLAESWLFSGGQRPHPDSPEGVFYALLAALGVKLGVFQAGWPTSPDGARRSPYPGADPNGLNLRGGYEFVRRQFESGPVFHGPFCGDYEGLVQQLTTDIMKAK